MLTVANNFPGVGDASPDVVERTTRIALVCEQFGVDLPTAALAFAARHPAIVSVVVGLRTQAEVEETMQRWNHPVPEGLWTALQDEGLLQVEPQHLQSTDAGDVAQTSRVRPEGLEPPTV